MHRHRFADLAGSPPAVPPAPAGFILVPLGPLSFWQQQLYLWAFQQAQAVVRPSRLERAQMVLPN